MAHFLRSKSSRVGLEIGPDDIKLVQLSRKNTCFTVENIGVAVLPQTIREGEIKPLAAVQALLTRLVQDTQTRGMVTALSLPDDVIFKNQTQLSHDQDAEEVLRKNREYYFPALHDAYVDYVMLSPPSQASRDTLFVAAAAYHVNTYLTLARQAGLIVKIIDVDSYALQRAQNQLHAVNPFLNMEFAPHLNQNRIEQMASRFLVCCGLAIRKDLYGRY